MAEVDFQLDHAAVDVMRGWNGEIGRSFERLAKETVFRQKDMANRKTGALRGSIHYKKGKWASGIQFDAGSPLGYAIFVEQGTKPHRITPRRAGGHLVFFWPKVGATVYLRSVNHPGNRAYKFLFRGLDRAMGVWDRSG